MADTQPAPRGTVPLREVPRAGELSRAASVAQAVGDTAGPAETTFEVVKPKSSTAICPNCERAWPVRAADKGSTLPCLCGFQISVA